MSGAETGLPAQPLRLLARDSREIHEALDTLDEMVRAGDIITDVAMDFMGRLFHGNAPEILNELHRQQLSRILTTLIKVQQRVDLTGNSLSGDELQQLNDFVSEVRQSREQLARVGLLTDVTEQLEQLQNIDELLRDLVSSIAQLQPIDDGNSKSPALSNKIGRDADGVRQPRTKDLLSQMGGNLPVLIEKLIAERYPALLDKFYPRIYESAGAYHSPKQCAAFLANVVAETIKTTFTHSPTAFRLLMPGLEQMARRRMPLFFVAPDLLEAVQRSDFHEDIDWTELPLPYEQGIFIMPKGAWSHPEDGEVSMIVWGRFEPGEYPPPARGIPAITVPQKAMVLLCLCPQTAIWYDSTLNSSVRPVIQLHNLFYRHPGEVTPRAKQAVPFLDADLTAKDESFLEELGAITFGLFLAMNARPELVEPGKLLRKVGKNEKVREFWSPNVIGPKYKLKREAPKIIDGKFARTTREGGTHASPRLHWRRGHFRQQPVGPQRRERKSIWIEPMLVGAE